MAKYALLERQRVRQRGRARPNAPGNFVTARIFAQWYTLTQKPTEKHYMASVLLKDVFSKAVGYWDNPKPDPAWIPLEPMTGPQFANFPPQNVEPPRVPPAGVPSGVTPVIPLAGRPGGQGIRVIGTSPVQLFTTTMKIRRVTILADSANAQEIWTGYVPQLQVANSFPLVPGAARDFDIDDLSQLWLVAENATDLVYFIYEV